MLLFLLYYKILVYSILENTLLISSKYYYKVSITSYLAAIKLNFYRETPNKTYSKYNY